MLLSEQKNKFIGSVTPNTAWMLFIASLGILTAFLTMMYFDNKPEITSASTTTINPLTSDSTESTAEALNDLTSQLMTERQLTNELHTKNEKLKQKLQKSATDTNADISAYEAVNEYLSALENIKKNKNLTDDKVSSTDYYNKVSITNNPNLLQNQINQFIENKNNGENIYLDSLKVESTIRNNEVRSIRLRKGESIWMLAKRAYGSGFKYHKIMAANPQITEKNAKFLKVGTLIRVPQ